MKPNILWSCTDQQRRDSLGCYGSSFMRTPNIDRLAESGVTFDRCYCQAPSCTPSRSSFLTGRYASTVHCEHNDDLIIPASERLLSKVLSENGYVCGLAGKLHLAAVHPNYYPNGERRIDDGFGVFNWSHDPYDKWPTNQYQLWLAGQGIKNQQEQIPDVPGQIYYGMPEEYHQSKWCTDRALEFIRKCHDHETPFFFCCDVYDPHPPFDPPKTCYDRMMERFDEIPDCRYTEGELDNKPHCQKEKNLAKRYDFNAMDETQRKKVKAAYYAQVENIDTHIGRILDLLDELGERENTLIIYSADHGEMLGDHGMFTKGSFYYDELTRIPLIMSWPGHLPAGKRYESLAEMVDIFPTICEIIGIEAGPRVQGKSMWPYLPEGKEMEKESVLCQSTGHASMLRTEDWKVVVFRKGNEGELYDMKNDPGEVHNLFYDEKFATVKADMLTKLMERELSVVEPGSKFHPGY